MKRRLYVSFVLGFLVLSSFWIYVRSDAFAAKIRPVIVDEVRRAIGPDTQIGVVKATLLPLSLEIRDIVIPARGPREAVAVRRIKLYLNPFPLIWRTVSVPSLTVLEPRISANRAANGTIDIVDLVQEIVANLRRPEERPDAFTVRLGTLQVRNGTFRIRDMGTSSKAVLQRCSFRTRMDLKADRVDVRMTRAALTVSSPSYGDLSASMKAGMIYERGRITISLLDLASEDVHAELSGTAGLDANAPISLRMAVSFSRKQPLSMRGMLNRARRTGPRIEGDIAINGTRDDPVLDGSVRFSGITAVGYGLDDGQLRISYRDGRGTIAGERWKLVRGAQSVQIDSVDIAAGYRDGTVEIVRAAISADQATLAASGRIDPRDGYHLSVTAESAGSASVLKMLTSMELSGDVAVRGSLAGPLADPRFSGSLSAGPLSVRGVLFQSVSGLVEYREKSLTVTGATILHGSSRYLFDGSADLRGSEARFQARLKVIRSDVVSIVALFYQRIPILLDATGELTFSGTRSEFTGHGRLDLGRGTAYGESFERGLVTAELSTNRISFPQVVLEKEGTDLSGSGWIGFDGTYEAQLAARGNDLARIDRISPIPASGPFTADVRSSGRFSGPVVAASFQSERLALGKFVVGEVSCDLTVDGGVLLMTADVRNGRDNAASASGSLKLQQPYAWSLVGRVQAENFVLSSDPESGDLLARSRASVDGGLKASGEGFTAAGIRGEAVLQRMAFSVADHRIENEGPVTLRLSRGTVIIVPFVLKGAGTRLALSGSTAFGEDLDLTFTGDANLSVLRGLFRAVEHADGSAVLKVSLRDEWSSPDIAGELVIRSGLLKIKDIPQRFTGLSGTVTFDRNRIVSEGISGEVGGGTITLSGSAELAGLSLQDFSTKSVIENVTVRYPPGLTATLGGTLNYDGTSSLQSLSGEIGIRKARYERRVDWKSMLVDFGKKFIPQKKAELGWIGDTQLNVRFVGKESILFENNLAKIPLEIDMLFRGTVNQVQVLGRVVARKGEVYFRRNTFRILHASADFADPNRINPALDIQAETRIRDYQIQVGVSGTADRAVVSFLSDPPLTDSDILSMLATGRKGEELRKMEAGIGMSEAASFATGKFQDILESGTRSITGLDRFQLDPYINKYDTTVPRVTAGKELLQDKLIMSYSSNIGGTIPEQNIRLEYILNRNVSVLGEYDELSQLGADIKFRFEFR